MAYQTQKRRLRSLIVGYLGFAGALASIAGLLYTLPFTDSATYRMVAAAMLSVVVAVGANIAMAQLLKRKQGYKVFLSYRHSDKEEAEKIKADLSEEMYRVVDASDDLPAGASIAEALEEMIEESDVFVLLLTKSTSESNWISNELEIARNKGKVIIPIRFDHAEIPESIANLRYVDFSEDTPKQRELFLKSLRKYYREQRHLNG